MLDKIFIDMREALLRIVALAFSAYFVVGVGRAFLADPHRVSLLLMTVSEGLTFVWLLLSRRPIVRDWEPATVAITFMASFGFSFISPGRGLAFLPEIPTEILQLSALAWVIYSKVSLGRAFALLPANRGLVTRGAYRLVRHPIYIGYFAGHMIFLASSFSLQNLEIYTMITICQLYRILREEALLVNTSNYRAYRRAVPYRFIPGII